MILLGIQSLQRFSGALSALPLIIPALFFLLFTDRRKAAARGCNPVMMRCAAWLALPVLLLVTAPVSCAVINRLLGGFGLKLCYLAAPVVPVYVYAATELMSYSGALPGADSRSGVKTLSGGQLRSGSGPWSAGRRAALCACLAAVALASVSVPWHFSFDGFRLISNPQKIDRDVYTVCSVIGNDTALMPPEVRAQIGEFDNDVKPAKKAYYHEGDPLATAYSAAKRKSTYVVVSRSDSKPEKLQRYGYKQFRNAGNYVIYRLQQ